MAAELLKRLFLSEIQPQLFADNGFVERGMKDDAFVNNNTVELPNSGTLPAVQVDRSSLPATIAKRTDVAHNYQLEELTTDPTLIQDSEELTVAYNKRASVLDQHGGIIREKCADRVLFAWGAALTGTSLVATTGSARAATGPSQTGNRLAVTKNDFLLVMKTLTQQEIPLENRVAVLTAEMYNDILGIDQFTDAEKFGRPGLPTGVITQILGFDIFIRSRVIILDSSDVVKAEGAAPAVDDQDGSLFFHNKFVRRAKGGIKIFLDIDKPEFYGSIFSAMMRFGAVKTRNDDKGIVVMFEDT